MRHELVDCAAEHLRALARHMCDADREEIEASGLAPLPTIETLARYSVNPKTLLIDGEVAACGGLLPGDGYCWLFITPMAKRALIIYLRAVRLAFADFRNLQPSVKVDIDGRYVASRRLAEWLGFRDVGAFPNPGGPYRHMEMELTP